MDVRVIVFALVSLFIFSGCGKESSEGSDRVMFTAEEINWSMENSGEDHWTSNTWEVSYDGTVEYSEKYNLTGVKNKKNWKLKKDQLRLLQEILETDFQTQKDAYDSAADGSGWDMVYYNKNHGEIYHFNGYIYGIEPLEKISSILGE